MPSQAVLDMVKALQNAGFNGQALVTMTSLGISESNGNPNALNPNLNTRDYSIGAFQINYYPGYSTPGSLYDARSAAFGPPNQLLGNLQAQANAAYKLSGGGKNFSPWQGDWTNGKVYKNMPAAQQAVDAVLGGAVATGSPGNASLLSSPPTLGQAVANGLLPGGSDTSTCLINLPSLNIPSVAGIGGSTIGGNCIFNKQQGKHVLGGLCILGGIMIAGLGVVLLLKNESLKEIGQAVGGKTKGILGSSSESHQDRRDAELEALAPPRGELARKKKLDDRRHTFDAKTGKNYLGESRDDVF